MLCCGEWEDMGYVQYLLRPVILLKDSLNLTIAI